MVSDGRSSMDGSAGKRLRRLRMPLPNSLDRQPEATASQAFFALSAFLNSRMQALRNLRRSLPWRPLASASAEHLMPAGVVAFLVAGPFFGDGEAGAALGVVGVVV